MGPKKSNKRRADSRTTTTTCAAPKKPKAEPSAEQHKTDTAHAGSAQTRKFFLMKSEVDVFSIDDMATASVTAPTFDEPWDGVRNHQAKNIQKSMRKADLAFFWGSNTKEPGIMGVIEVTREAFPDESQFDKSSKYYDATATRETPRWFNVAVRLCKKLENPVLLKDLKQRKELEHMPLFTQSRLSVQTVPADAWNFICREMNREELGEFSSSG